MTRTKPIIVFTPGAWHTPDCFDLVKERLESRGYTVVAIALPSVGAEPPTISAAEDVDAIRLVLEKLANESSEIMLIAHSYGAVVASSSLRGLGAVQRACAGKKGGVVMFMIMAGFVVPSGKTFRDTFSEGAAPLWLRIEGNYVYVDNPDKVFYHDVPGETQQKAVNALRHQSHTGFFYKVEYEPWHDITCSYLVCDDDASLPPSAQLAMASQLGPDAAIYHIKSSHSPFLSRPEETTDIIEKAVAFIQDKDKS